MIRNCSMSSAKEKPISCTTSSPPTTIRRADDIRPVILWKQIYPSQEPQKSNTSNQKAIRCSTNTIFSGQHDNHATRLSTNQLSPTPMPSAACLERNLSQTNHPSYKLFNKHTAIPSLHPSCLYPSCFLLNTMILLNIYIHILQQHGS